MLIKTLLLLTILTAVSATSLVRWLHHSDPKPVDAELVKGLEGHNISCWETVDSHGVVHLHKVASAKIYKYCGFERVFTDPPQEYSFAVTPEYYKYVEPQLTRSFLLFTSGRFLKDNLKVESWYCKHDRCNRNVRTMLNDLMIATNQTKDN